MLSVRVAAAVARALPRRAGLVRTGGWLEGGSRQPRWRLHGLGLSFCAKGEGLWRAAPYCPAGRSAWPGLSAKGCSASPVREGAGCCRGDSDLRAVWRWRLGTIPVFVREAGEGPWMKVRAGALVSRGLLRIR